MVKLKNMKWRNFMHTIIHFILWIVFAIVTFFYSTKLYEPKDSLFKIISLEFPLYLDFFIIYLSTGIFFDLIIYFLNRKRYKKMVFVFRRIFIFITMLFSLWLFSIIYMLINWRT